MITLITGVPGSGKSAYVVSELMQLQGRHLIVDGIPDLVVPHEPAQDVTTWHEWVPHGSLVVVDECQRYFRPRATGSKVPDCVAHFETHRHRGLDFWLITQHPNLLDSNVRRLVGRHIHIRATALGRYMYEWPQVADPDSPSDRDISAKRKYTLPKAAFQQYKSAEIHTKQKLRLPTAAWVVIIALVLGGLLAAFSYNRVSDKLEPATVHPIDHYDQAPRATPGAQPQGRPGEPGQPWRPQDYTPVNFNVPESAPIYDELRKPKSLPRIAACISSRSRCKCYTQQGTALPGVSPDYCRSLAEGMPFNPYQEESQAGDGGAAPHIDAAFPNQST